MQKLELTLPVPVSVNQMYLNLAGRGRVKTSAYKSWIKTADILSHLQWRKAGEPHFGAGFKVTIFLPMNMRGDVDNRIKPILDLLVRRKITVDDRKAHEVRACRATWLEPECVVWVEAGT